MPKKVFDDKEITLEQAGLSKGGVL